MIGQLSFDMDGTIRDKVEVAVKRLQMFEPPDGYYVAFSGGKDSQCVYHLCQMAGVKFDAHYSVTTVDPPELCQFIREKYPDAWAGRVIRMKDGKQVTMWSLIEQKRMPPTRMVRYCCEKLKESGGQGRVTVTGVRWAESSNRQANQGVVTLPNAGKKVKKKVSEMTESFIETKRGGLVLNDDNDESRRVVEQCYRTSKTILNPIIDWSDDDVWDFLNSNGIEHCKLYDEGYQRLGCIGCPMSNNAEKGLERWPKYREMYRRAFDKMLKARIEAGLPCNEWSNADDVFDWWIRGR